MAIDATELTTLRDNLVRARAKGVRELQMNGERVRYGSDAEMAAAIAALDTRIARIAASRPSAVRFSSSKGV